MLNLIEYTGKGEKAQTRGIVAVGGESASESLGIRTNQNLLNASCAEMHGGLYEEYHEGICLEYLLSVPALCEFSQVRSVTQAGVIKPVSYNMCAQKAKPPPSFCNGWSTGKTLQNLGIGVCSYGVTLQQP